MTKRKRVIFRVVPHSKGWIGWCVKSHWKGWGVRSPLNDHSCFSRGMGFTKQDAVGYAITEAKGVASGGGLASVVIHKRDGTIQEERTYPRSSDPRRTKG